MRLVNRAQSSRTSLAPFSVIAMRMEVWLTPDGDTVTTSAMVERSSGCQNEMVGVISIFTMARQVQLKTRSPRENSSLGECSASTKPNVRYGLVPAALTPGKTHILRRTTALTLTAQV